ncbi:hypothetical protein GIB67_032869 [Kingdonia uniflora]|uniref:Pentatricopeptide repeat-containing protein n=1 Tax=Kingdonia uniflora TaxID=39325 RepID=A0A7J7NBL9_9MAGN|nr:hypothetical protein GIB67_032869 [Kingdonia uniflora]
MLTQNPRFFSQDPTFTHHNVDENSFFDQNPSFVSQDEDTHSVVFDETHQDTHSVVFDETPTNGGEFEGENPSFVLEEVDIVQLENLLSVLQSSLDESLASVLNKMELTLSEEFVIRVVETPVVPGHLLIGFFRWVMKVSDGSVSTQGVQSLIRGIYAGRKIKEAYYLWDLVKEIGEKEKEKENEKGLLNTEILNELIALFQRLGKGKAALEVFNKFEEFGCELNTDSYCLTIEALFSRKLYDWAWTICEQMLNTGNWPDCKKIGNLISCFCDGGKAKDAHLVYLMAKDKDKYPPQSSVDYLISSLCKSDESVKLALEMLEDFTGDGRKNAIKHFSTVIGGLCRIKNLEGANKLLFEMIDKGPIPGNAVFNTVITGFAKARKMDVAIGLVKVMESRGLQPDVYTYNVLMSGYKRGGEMEEVVKVLNEAKKKHSKLSSVTYDILIHGYCNLQEFDKALEAMNEMKNAGMKPIAGEYSHLIHSLCRNALDWRTSEKLLEEMNENGLNVTGATRALVRAVKEMEVEELKDAAVGMEA